jgi:hypothetical protein
MDESSDVLRDEKKEHPFVFFITIVSARGLPKTTGGGLNSLVASSHSSQ